MLLVLKFFDIVFVCYNRMTMNIQKLDLSIVFLGNSLEQYVRAAGVFFGLWVVFKIF